jgi:Zn-dependent M28 family amino/carboxypeptidase
MRTGRSFRLAMLLPVAASAAIGCLLAQAPPVERVAIDSAPLFQDLRTLSGDDMQGRAAGTAGGEKARAFVVARFIASGIMPFGREYTQAIPTPGRGGTAANVIGFVRGTREPGRYIVVSAHYDHVGVTNGQVFNGANDNASGTAALFALGQYFTTERPAHSIIFAAFDAEEIGLLGSRAFVKSPPVDRAALAVNVNADMIGRDARNTLWAVGTARQPFLRPYVERVAARAPVTLAIGHEDWLADSDQFAFIEAGIPALYFGVDDTSQHHKSTDDYETMTHGFYVGAVETLALVVREIDRHLETIVMR